MLMLDTPTAAQSFTNYIAEAQRQDFHQALSKKHFYSILMDGTTDAGKLEKELVVILTSWQDDMTREMRAKYPLCACNHSCKW